VRSKKPAGLA